MMWKGLPKFRFTHSERAEKLMLQYHDYFGFYYVEKSDIGRSLPMARDCHDFSVSHSESSAKLLVPKIL